MPQKAFEQAATWRGNVLFASTYSIMVLPCGQTVNENPFKSAIVICRNKDRRGGILLGQKDVNCAPLLFRSRHLMEFSRTRFD